MAIDPNDLDGLQKALNDAAGKASVLWTTFIIFQLYLAIAFGSVTHRDLFLEATIKLPLLNVDLPLIGFFVLAPVILLIFHFYVLLQLAGLASKAREYNTLLAAEVPAVQDRQRMRQRVDVFPILQFLAGPKDQRTGFIGFSLRLIAWITLVGAPILILLQAQVTFLPYQRESIVWLQRITVLIDLAVVWYFWIRLRSEGDPISWVPRKFKTYVGGAGALCVSIFSIYLATFPGEWMKMRFPEPRYVPISWPPHWSKKDDWTSLQALLFEGAVDTVSLRPRSVFSNRLVLTGPQSFVVDPEELDKIFFSRSFRGRDLRLAVLPFADLRKADFSGAHLQGATLNSAQLQGAWFEEAEMQGAILSWAQLQGAKLVGAQLQGASLDLTKMQGARLGSAQLQGASLEGAELQGASLDGAKLQGASLGGAKLQAASLAWAELQGASLGGAKLQGALLTVVMVWRANGRPDMSLTHVDGFDPDTVPWPTDSTFAAWRDAILETIPRGLARDEALRRLSALDPSPEEEPGGVIKAEFWKDVSNAPQGDEREKQLAAFLADLACSREGAPYVARGLIGNGGFESMGLQIASVADRLRRGKSDQDTCPGVRGLTDEDWSNLDELVVNASR